MRASILFAPVLRQATATATLCLMALVVLVLPARAIDIQRVVSPGGIEAWLVEDNTVPLITMNFAFQGGASQDPADLPGVASMLSVLLDEGAGDYSALEFQERLEELAVRMNFDAGRDEFYGELQAIVDVREEAFDLLRTALMDPHFEADAVERMRAALLARANRDLSDPGRVAARAWAERVFGDHPYGRSSTGTVESLQAITIDDLRVMHERTFARSNLVISVVGAIDAETLGLLLDQTFGGLPETAELMSIEPVTDYPEGFVENIEMDIPQTSIQFGRPGLMRDDPDFMAAFVANHILGGGSFSSRLFQEVREERGLVYSVFSALYALDNAGAFLGAAGTRAERANETIEVVEAEIARLIEEGLSAEDVEAAKDFLKGSYALRFTTSSSIATQLLQIQIEDLGIDYVNTRNDLIDAVTAEDATRAARRLLGDGSLWVVTVGQMPTGG
ncbi:MAG: pitrilysin family protein [Pseudomonadota bacterium]